MVVTTAGQPSLAVGELSLDSAMAQIEIEAIPVRHTKVADVQMLSIGCPIP